MGDSAYYDEVVANLRACLLSAKGGVSLSELNNDYKKIVGESIPYRRMGYPSLEEFLNDVPGLLITRRGNDWNIMAKPTEDTVHLAQMIARQKSSSSKTRTRGLTAKRERPAARSRRTPSQFDMPSMNSQPKRGSSTNYRAVQRVPSVPPLMQIQPKKTIPPLMERPPRYMLPNPGIPQASPSKQLSDRMANKSANSITGNQTPTVAYKNKVQPQNPISEKRTPPASTPLITSKSGPSSQARNSQPVQTQPKVAKTVSDRLNFKPPTSPSPPTVLSPLSPSQLVAAAAAADSIASLTPPVTPKISPVMPLSLLSSHHQNPCQRLEIYTEIMNLSKPSYKVVKSSTKRQSFFYCKVKIGTYNCTSYPDEIPTSEEATRAVATKALKELLQINGPLSSLTETTNKDLVKDRVLAIVAEHSNGVFMHQIPKYYQEKWKENLPEDWEKIIVETSDIFKEKGAHDSTILCLPYSSPASNQRNSDRVAESLSPRVEKIELNPIGPPVPGVLKPPVDEYWDLCITCILDTTDIWARLIGEEFSDRVDTMLSELENYYQKVSNVPGVRDIEVGNYYVVQVEGYWQRVQCLEYNAQSGMAVVFFIDDGDDDSYHYSKLYPLEKQFCKVPAQAVKLTLANLEVFNDCSNVIEYLEEVLLGQTFVAEVLSRELGEEVTASVVLYDTSKEDQEVNLNDLLFCKISENILAPKLNQGHVAEVYVHHVTDGGDVYLHVKSDSMKYLVSLMNTLIQTGLTSEDIQRSEVKSIDKSKLYLVRCAEDANWYRGSITNIEAHNRIEVFLVDFGKTVVVRKKQDLLALDQLSEVLTKYPYQAFKVRLHNIPETMLNSEIATKLTLLAPRDQVILVKIVTPASASSPPIVELFKRCEPNNMIVSINSTLAMDPNFTASDGDGNNNTTRPKKRLERSVSRHSAAGDGELLMRILRPPVIPDFGLFFDVHITMAASPGNFTVQPFDDRVHLEAMMVQLQEVCVNYTGSAPMPDSIKEGSLYAGKHFDGHFYRVCVSKIINDQMVTVYFCDFGDFSILSTDRLQPLGRQFLDLPYQAIKAKLVGIQPLNIDWSVEDCLRFQELVVERNFVSIVVDSGPDRLSPGDTVLGLQLIDVSGETDIYLDQLLIAEGRATAIEG